MQFAPLPLIDPETHVFRGATSTNKSELYKRLDFDESSLACKIRMLPPHVSDPHKLGPIGVGIAEENIGARTWGEGRVLQSGAQSRSEGVTGSPTRAGAGVMGAALIMHQVASAKVCTKLM